MSVSVTDGAHVAVQNFSWDLAEIDLASMSDVVDLAGDTTSIQASAHDDFNQPITYSSAGLPSGVGIDATSGLISGTVAAPASGDGLYAVTVTASAGGYSASKTFNWSVTQLALTAPANQLNAEGDRVSVAVASNAPAGTTLQFSASGLPGGLSIDNNGVISGTIASGANANSPYMVMVSASDGMGASASTNFTWTVGQIEIAPIPDQAIGVGQQVNIPIVVTDNIGGPVTCSAGGLPPGLSVTSQGSNSWAITGTVASGAIAGSPYTVVVQAQDPQGHSASTAFTMAVAALTVTSITPSPIVTGFIYAVPPNLPTPLSRTVKIILSDPTQAKQYVPIIDSKADRATIGQITYVTDGTGFDIVTTVLGQKASLGAAANKKPADTDTFLEVADFATKKTVLPGGKAPVIVVVPAYIASQEYRQARVSGKNFSVNATTSPTYIGLAPGKTFLTTYYITTLKVIVYDQFKNPLDTIYNGQAVYEMFKETRVNINQTVTSSIYSDPVGQFTSEEQGGRVIDDNKANAETIKKWLSAPPLPFKGKAGTTTVPLVVEIAGQTMKANRTITIITIMGAPTELLLIIKDEGS